jgi:putative nucleotidyltransferase with HDIG domain
MKVVFQQARLGRAVSGESMMPLVQSIAASVTRNPYALTSVARLKHHDGYTYMHSVAVCALMSALARELGLDEQGVLEDGTAGLLHDLGKALMPLAVLNKPGKLSVEESEVAKKHSYDGWHMLQSADVSSGVPVVKTFFSCKSYQPAFPAIVDLKKLKGADKIVAIEDPRQWNFPQFNDLWLNQGAPFA